MKTKEAQKDRNAIYFRMQIMQIAAREKKKWREKREKKTKNKKRRERKDGDGLQQRMGRQAHIYFIQTKYMKRKKRQKKIDNKE